MSGYVDLLILSDDGMESLLPEPRKVSCTIC
jgi:hypothetical protein